MTDDVKAIRDDLAFLRALAEDGQRTPLVGGSRLAAAGGCYGLASFVQWLILAQVIAVPPVSVFGVWLLAMLVHLSIQALSIRRLAAKPGAESTANRASHHVWSAVGVGCFVLMAALAVASWKARTDVLIGFAPSIVLVLYGAAWWVAASVSNLAWIRAVALASFATAIGLGLLIGSAWVWLAYAGALFLLALLPGLAMMRQEPSIG
ncbi:hypothetical protein [Caulobacter sp. 1776]|uniref:hypothetical protein n=1 Tax=Caulobacter sp. 1776 TaxID=3156420 RepID=UPI0033952BC4